MPPSATPRSASSSAPAKGAARAPATNPELGLRPITYVRKFALRENDEMRVAIASDGSYVITRRGGGGANSRKLGTLTPDQRRELLATFTGWDGVDDDYPDPGGADELYRITIGFGGKTVTASDAALNLPKTFRDAYRQLRELVSEAGMV